MLGSRIVKLAIAGMAVFGSAERAVADVQYSFTTIDVPGAAGTRLLGINDLDQIVGSFFYVAPNFHGFLYSDDVFTATDAPGFANQTSFAGINNLGQIVGSADGHGFLDSNGLFTFFDAPNSTAASQTGASGINDSTQIVGSCFNCSGVIDGFIYHNGASTPISVPGATETQIYGINNLGQIVGSVFENDGQYGLLYSNGIFTLITIPGVTPDLQIRGINNRGQLVGTNFVDNEGFVDSGGIFVPIDIPSSTSTIPTGINDSGQIVGFYTDGNGATHGFLATPVPEPRILPVLAACLIGLFAMAYRRKVARGR